MRQLILPAILALLLCSCHKKEEAEPVACRRCSVTTVAMIDATRETSTDTLCNRTKGQIEAYVKAGNWQLGTGGNGVPYGSFYAGGYSSVSTDCVELR